MKQIVLPEFVFFFTWVFLIIFVSHGMPSQSTDKLQSEFCESSKPYKATVSLEHYGIESGCSQRKHILSQLCTDGSIKVSSTRYEVCRKSIES